MTTNDYQLQWEIELHKNKVSSEKLHISEKYNRDTRIWYFDLLGMACTNRKQVLWG